MTSGATVRCLMLMVMGDGLSVGVNFLSVVRKSTLSVAMMETLTTACATFKRLSALTLISISDSSTMDPALLNVRML